MIYRIEDLDDYMDLILEEDHKTSIADVVKKVEDLISLKRERARSNSLQI